MENLSREQLVKLRTLLIERHMKENQTISPKRNSDGKFSIPYLKHV